MDQLRARPRQGAGADPGAVTALAAIREEFAKEASRIGQDIRAAEDALAQLYARTPLDLAAAEARIKEIAARHGELRLARVRALAKGLALLTEEQRQRLFSPSPPMGRPGA